MFEINFSLSEPTEPEIEERNVTGTAGEPFSVECKSSAPLNLVEPTSIHWLDSSGSVVSNNKTLFFPVLYTSDAGIYTCVVNISISQLNLSLSGSGNITVNVRGKFNS